VFMQTVSCLFSLSKVFCRCYKSGATSATKKIISLMTYFTYADKQSHELTDGLLCNLCFKSSLQKFTNVWREKILQLSTWTKQSL
jgi:hypothetical protein